MTEKKTAKKTATKKATKPLAKKKRQVSTSTVSEDVKPYIARPHRFIDLFCGIGGFRSAFEKAGGKCVFSSDYEKIYLKVVSVISVPRQLLAVD